MDKKIIKGLIDEKLEVIQEQFAIIREYEGKIPIIEVDLIMTSIRDLYELVLNLQLENMGSIIPKLTPPPETPKVPPAAEPIAPARISSSFISMEPVSVEKPAPEPPAPEPPGQLAPEPLSPESPELLTPVEEEAHDLNQQQQEKYQRITFDLFSDGAGTTLADRLRDGQEKRIADKLQENQVVDLRTTIGINDKFLFINELFEGNMRIYDEAILKLNTSTTMAQADMLLLDLKIAYNWDSESPTVKKFVELVRRKF